MTKERVAMSIPGEQISPERRLAENSTAANRGSTDDAASEVHLTTRLIARRYSVTWRTIERWRRDPDLNFPKPDLAIGDRKFWKLATIEKWEPERAQSVAPIKMTTNT
jgi:hypothetical protein